MKESKTIIVYDDYNSLIPQDQSVIGTVRQTFGHTALRNGFKIIETNMAEQQKSNSEVMQVGNIMQEKNFANPQCGRIYSTKGLSPTINTCGGGQREPKIINDMADQNTIELPSELKGKKFRIRKLTPRECFRLMGVDDKDIDKIQAAKVSNSAQYKLAGNSIVVDVLFHIFRRMFIETEEPDFDGTPTQLTLF